MRSLVAATLLAAGYVAAHAEEKTWKFTDKSPVPEVDPSSILDLKDTVTLEAWIKPEKQASGGGRIIDKLIAGSSVGYLLDT